MERNISTNNYLQNSNDDSYTLAEDRKTIAIFKLYAIFAFLMGVATLDQTMVFSVGYFEESYDGTKINRFLDYLEDELTGIENT
ncbi:MAG: hypothetical protein FK733_15885 [Asgard group archaeon]|nr:hypothetical protein [Asgard group archaeon]